MEENCKLWRVVYRDRLYVMDGKALRREICCEVLCLAQGCVMLGDVCRRELCVVGILYWGELPE